MEQKKLIEDILKASKAIDSVHGNADYIVISSTVASILKGMEIRSERKRKIKKIVLWN